jgi:hypothetical protein
LRRTVTQPILQGRAEEENRQTQDERDPEAVAEHDLVPGVAAVAAVSFVARMLIVAVVHLVCAMHGAGVLFPVSTAVLSMTVGMLTHGQYLLYR